MEFGLASGRRGPQALSLKLIDPPHPRQPSAPGGPVEHKHSPDELHGMVEDMITLLETTVQPELRKGRYRPQDRRAISRWSKPSPGYWTPERGRRLETFRCALKLPSGNFGIGAYSHLNVSRLQRGGRRWHSKHRSPRRSEELSPRSSRRKWLGQTSFCQEGLFLGRFPLECAAVSQTNQRKTRRAPPARFLDKLREFLDTIDGSVIERDAQIPDEYVKGLAALGCFA